MVFHSSSDVSIPNSSSVVLYLTPPWVPFTHTSGISSRGVFAELDQIALWHWAGRSHHVLGLCRVEMLSGGVLSLP